MVLRQCLACNATMTESCRSCVCGHVFEDVKKIGGKRFSEYRAELYIRLENRRQKQLTQRNRKTNLNEREKGAQPLKERKTNIEEARVPPSGFKPKPHSSFSSKPFHRRIKGKRISRPIKPSPSTAVVPPGLVSRLPSALQEINRRLTGQNLTWWVMQLQ